MKTIKFLKSAGAVVVAAAMLVLVSCEKEVPVTSLALDQQEAEVQVGNTVTLLSVIDEPHLSHRSPNGDFSNSAIFRRFVEFSALRLFILVSTAAMSFSTLTR